MKVKLIGTGCIGTMQNSACSLINKKILIDIPNGACREIKRFGEDLNSIQTIIITHYHADHIFDLPFIILEKSQMTNKKMNIVGPKDIEKRTKDLFELAFPGEWKEKIEDNLEINFMEILSGEIKYIEDTTIEAVKVEHMLPDSQGYIIIIDNQMCAFTGDTSKCDAVEYMLKKSPIIVSDCSVEIGKQTHMGIDNIKEYSEKYPNNTIILTHMKEATRLEAEKLENSNIIVPGDGYSIEF